MRRFGTQGPVHPAKNYVVSRATELADFVMRVKEGRYIVIFAPRQTGKTTFFQRALDVFSAEEPAYFPIPLNFEVYEGCTPPVFYSGLYEDLLEAIENVFARRGEIFSEALAEFLESAEITDHLSMQRFFRNFSKLLGDQRVILIIDEFDGIPKEAVKGFLHSLRRIYVSNPISRCPHSVGIVGVKSITQFNCSKTISPFNIQDEFNLPNFTLEQVQELLGQYTAEVGQAFAPEVIESIHKQTAGHPVLVNRFAQILTEESDIPKTQPIRMAHFATAHAQLLEEGNVNLTHLLTNIRGDRRFETLLMKIASYDIGIPFTRHNEIMNELATYGVIKESTDGMCEILNPIYFYCILREFKPIVNGLEQEYFRQEVRDEFQNYFTSTEETE